MTCSAPSFRTRSTCWVLHTPVTFAPRWPAICTANVPTPPEPPQRGGASDGTSDFRHRTCLGRRAPVKGADGRSDPSRPRGNGHRPLLRRGSIGAAHIVLVCVADTLPNSSPRAAHNEPSGQRQDDRVAVADDLGSED